MLLLLQGRDELAKLILFVPDRVNPIRSKAKDYEDETDADFDDRAAAGLFKCTRRSEQT
ncbi:hypothetical protein [Cohaesibacter gelatinilyticus]|uniref:hypothetical protein n=1 Tax=Cohaesibacter gelatinilyticus TaxID=372072 RepID=UPI0014836250|nr:hypothetical protein [Cohaesibacter gelatinilyticus]